MSQEAMREIIDRAVADYGFRLAVMWGPGDIIAGYGLNESEARALMDKVVPELKRLPDPVEPRDHAAVQERLAGLAFSG